MSANKSAHALVGLLNDLFGRFDRLCELTCCEKISTLGDCYYCVAGCPEPRPEHAYCCVEMGLGMIQAIEQFCQETRETVDMRVGVHTGTVLCGILGIKRFKFDVWSNDVNLANLMEQLGVAGKVHLSEATGRFLDDRYQREDGQVAERAGQTVMEKLKGKAATSISFFFLSFLLKSEINGKVGERGKEGKTCIKGPWAGFEAGSMPSGLGLNGTRSSPVIPSSLCFCFLSFDVKLSH